MPRLLVVALLAGVGGLVGAGISAGIVWLTHPGGTQPELAIGSFVLLGLAFGGFLGWEASKPQAGG
jgi:hypothetical protein